MEALIVSEYAAVITQSSLTKALVSSESAFWSVKNDWSFAKPTLTVPGYLNFLNMFGNRFQEDALHCFQNRVRLSSR